MLIGDKLKEIRKSKKMSLTELCEKSGVQMATLSRIEHKKMTGTLESHMAIAKALGIDVVELYDAVIRQTKEVEISQAAEKSEIFTHNDKCSFEILTKNVLSKQMMPTLIRIEAGGSTQQEQGSANSEKFIFILDGAVDVVIDNKTFHLKKNNTLYFNASLLHMFKSASKNTVKILSVATPVAL